MLSAIRPIAYAPWSLEGPSMSIASVRPSAEKLWQFAHVGMSVSTTRLSGRETSFSRQATRSRASGASGWIVPACPIEGISGTSR